MANIKNIVRNYDADDNLIVSANIDGIQFNNIVNEDLGLSKTGIMSRKNTIWVGDATTGTSILPTINAVDIDWNGAKLGGLPPINTTGEMIDTLMSNSKVNTLPSNSGNAYLLCVGADGKDQTIGTNYAFGDKLYFNVGKGKLYNGGWDDKYQVVVNEDLVYEINELKTSYISYLSGLIKDNTNKIDTNEKSINKIKSDITNDLSDINQSLDNIDNIVNNIYISTGKKYTELNIKDYASPDGKTVLSGKLKIQTSYSNGNVTGMTTEFIGGMHEDIPTAYYVDTAINHTKKTIEELENKIKTSYATINDLSDVSDRLTSVEDKTDLIVSSGYKTLNLPVAYISNHNNPVNYTDLGITVSYGNGNILEFELDTTNVEDNVDFKTLASVSYVKYITQDFITENELNNHMGALEANVDELSYDYNQLEIKTQTILNSFNDDLDELRSNMVTTDTIEYYNLQITEINTELGKLTYNSGYYVSADDFNESIEYITDNIDTRLSSIDTKLASIEDKTDLIESSGSKTVELPIAYISSPGNPVNYTNLGITVSYGNGNISEVELDTTNVDDNVDFKTLASVSYVKYITQDFVTENELRNVSNYISAQLTSIKDKTDLIESSGYKTINLPVAYISNHDNSVNYTDLGITVSYGNGNILEFELDTTNVEDNVDFKTLASVSYVKYITYDFVTQNDLSDVSSRLTSIEDKTDLIASSGSKRIDLPVAYISDPDTPVYANLGINVLYGNGNISEVTLDTSNLADVDYRTLASVSYVKGITSLHSENNDIHVTLTDKTNWNNAKSAIDTFLSTNNLDEIVESLQGIQDYINNEGSIADQLTTSINNNAKAIEAESSRARGAESQINSNLSLRIQNNYNTCIAKIEENTTKINTAESNAIDTSKNYTNTEIGKLSNVYDIKGAAATAKTEAIKAASTDATTKANTAKSEAITAAATDATTKANAAKTAAIDTAATDATTKANTAKAEAIAESTTIATNKANAAKTAAIDTAAADATTKANAAKNAAIAAAATDATTKANTAKAEAIAAAKTDAENFVINKIGALDYNDTDVDYKYVSKVSQTDGKIKVERKILTTKSSSGIIKYDKTGSNINLPAGWYRIAKLFDYDSIVSYPFGYQIILNFEGNSISQSSTILINSTAGDSSCVIKELSSTKYDSEHPVFSHVRVVTSINPNPANRSAYLEIYVPNSKPNKISSVLYYSIHCTGGSPLENHKFELIKGDDKGYVYKDDIFKVQDYTGDQTKSNNEREYFKIRVCKLSPTETPNLNHNDVEFYNEFDAKVDELIFREQDNGCYRCDFTIKVDPGLNLDMNDINDVNIEMSNSSNASFSLQKTIINGYTIKYYNVNIIPNENFSVNDNQNCVINIILQKSVKYPIRISLVQSLS